ncbi:MAG: heavy-metal-associated domain-containing protein [Candidatus Heimdallarchaeaceae archaeon]
MQSQIKVEIPDIHCKKCAAKIKLALDYTAGVNSVELHVDDKYIIAEIDSFIISRQRLKTLLIALGFSALLI